MPWLRRIEPILRPLWQSWSRHSRGLSIGVRGLVVNEKGEILLIEHTYTSGWYMPGGGVDRDETTEEAVVRELREEAGVEALSRPRLISIHDNRRLFRGDHVLLYRIDQFREGAPTQQGEILNRGWFSPDALPQDTTPSTRRRIAEALHGDDPDPMW